MAIRTKVKITDTDRGLAKVLSLADEPRRTIRLGGTRSRGGARGLHGGSRNDPRAGNFGIPARHPLPGGNATSPQTERRSKARVRRPRERARLAEGMDRIARETEQAACEYLRGGPYLTPPLDPQTVEARGTPAPHGNRALVDSFRRR